MPTKAKRPAAKDPAYVSGNYARTLLGGSGWYRLHKHVITGEIRTDLRLGQHVTFCLEDVRRVADRLKLDPHLTSDDRARAKANEG
jgi:hypothetical protein